MKDVMPAVNEFIHILNSDPMKTKPDYRRTAKENHTTTQQMQDVNRPRIYVRYQKLFGKNYGLQNRYQMLH
jgi:hypothetical protein